MENKILEEIVRLVGTIDAEFYEHLSLLVEKAGRVFVAGTGRSGLIGRCFAMRLRHLSIEGYVAGETICPPIKRGDLLVAISCSGNKKTLVELARISEKTGAKVICITAKKDSSLTKVSDFQIVIPVKKSRQFGNSLFEQGVFIFLETFVEYFRKTKKISTSQMMKKHTNLE
jgi:6-phospho 3-hexuloisomerase